MFNLIKIAQAVNIERDAEKLKSLIIENYNHLKGISANQDQIDYLNNVINGYNKVNIINECPSFFISYFVSKKMIDFFDCNLYILYIKNSFSASKLIGLPDSFYNNEILDFYYNSIDLYSLYLILRDDDRLFKLNPNIATKSLNKLIKSEMETYLYNDSIIFSRIVEVKYQLDNYEFYKFVEKLLEYCETNLNQIIDYVIMFPQLNGDFIKYLKNRPIFYKYLIINEKFIKNLCNKDILLTLTRNSWESLSEHYVKSSFKDNRYPWHLFSKELYDLLDANGVLYYLNILLNNDELLAKFPFVDEGKIICSLLYYDVGFGECNLVTILKHKDKVLNYINENNDHYDLKLLLEILFDSKKILLGSEMTNNIYKNTLVDIFDHDVRRKHSLMTSSYFDSTHSVLIDQDSIFNAKDHVSKIEETAEQAIEIGKEICKKGMDSLSISSIKFYEQNGFYKFNTKEKNKAINNSLKDTLIQLGFENEYETIRKQLGSFIVTWGNVRIFIIGDSEHDTWEILVANQNAHQPMLSSFLQKELHTDLDYLSKLLTIRGSALRNKKILPGKERPEDLQGKYYPDNRKGLLSYESKRDIGDLNETQYKFYEQLQKFVNTDLITRFFSKLNIPEKHYIPFDQTEIDGFVFKVLDKDDPLGAVLGNLTGCCQRLGGAGEECVYDGYNNPKSGFLAVFKGKQIIAQSWLRVGTSGILYLDNIEANSIYDENYSEEKPKYNIMELFQLTDEQVVYLSNSLNERGILGDSLLRNAFLKWGKHIRQKKNEQGEKLFSEVVVGGNYADVTFPDHNYNWTINMKEEFGDSSSIYSDLNKKQDYKIAFNLRHKYKLF
jgi:hypothetical protein